MYHVKEIFDSIQGEGYWTGTPCTFVRFSGCNLWSGREEDRSKAVCKFCDTDFINGFKVSADTILKRTRHERVVLTGGEPALQFNDSLKRGFIKYGKTIHMETNGTVPLEARPHWLTVSPKAGTEVVIKNKDIDEVKIVYPQELDPHEYDDVRIKYLQPMDGNEDSVRLCLDFIRSNEDWSLSLQTHKFLNLP